MSRLADVGQAINPVLCEGQDEGGVMNAIGHSLLEEMVYKDGQLLNPNLVDYRVPTFAHVPKDFESILVESRQRPRTLRFQGHRRGQACCRSRRPSATRFTRRRVCGCTICRLRPRKYGAVALSGTIARLWYL